MESEGRTQKKQITSRTFIAGLVLVVLIAVASFYVTIVDFAAYRFGNGVPAPAPFAVLFLITAIVSLPVIRRYLHPSRAELLAVYVMTLAGAPLLSWGVLGWMLPHSIVPRYLARAMPSWEENLLQFVPTWFSPTDRQVVEDFFLGQASVPWAHWWVPLLAWCSFLVAMSVAEISLIVLLRRQWIENERLSFPLAQIPLDTVKERDEGGGRLPRTLVFWIGLMITTVYSSLYHITLRYPSVPQVPEFIVLMQYQKVGPLAGLGQVTFWILPTAIAIAYLIPKELSLSCWLFWWVRVALTVAAIAAGGEPNPPEEWWGSGFPAPGWQGVGALLALAGWTAWIARRHIGHVIRITLRRGHHRGEADEPAMYRVAMVLLLLSLCWLVGFLWFAGARVGVAVAVVALIVLFHVVWARLRAEAGLGFISFPQFVGATMIETLGSRSFRPRDIAVIMSTRWAYFSGGGSSAEIISGNALESLKIADEVRLRTRPVLLAMSAAFALALFFGVYVLLTGSYHYGFYAGLRASTDPDPWLGEQLRVSSNMAVNYLTTPTSFDPKAVLAASAGGLTAVVLGILRLRLWWWPLHPIGYLAANTWAMCQLWGPFLVGWLWKTLTVRYGGLRLYRRSVPFATGLIAGDLLSQTMWAIINVVTQSGL